jgi:DNA repair exonuclease SbcCD ATPase subunit
LDLAALADRLANLEAVPASVDNLGKAIRHELERCASVLFGHDRALGALAARLDEVEMAGPARAVDAAADLPRASDEALARVLEQVDRFDQRLAAMESRVIPLEPLPTVVQALRRAVRASDDQIAGETAAREQALAALASQQAIEAQSRDDALRGLVAQDLDRVTGVSAAQAKGLADVAERLAATEARLGPLDSVPDDIAALSRILRRELDAIVTDNQARDQMLRRALQNEIDQLLAASEARDVLTQGLGSRLDALEGRSAEVASASEAALAAAAGRLEALEARIAAVDRIGTDLEALSATVDRELEQLRAGGQTHDQLAGELTRRLSTLDARLARLDPVPGEVQSLRTAIQQEAERTVTALRAADERVGQLSWVPGEFQEARKRIMALTSGVQTGQDRIRQLESALASLSERLEHLRSRIPAATPPGSPG